MFAFVQAAGWPIWPLLLASILALALVIDRLFHLQESRVAPPQLLDEVIAFSRKAVPSANVIQKLGENSVLGAFLASGFQTLVQDPLISPELLRTAMEVNGRRAIHKLEKYLTALGTIASAAPLLGLLGTVIGMIEIFGAQAPGGSNPAQLAHGISVALYNTAFGLMVAIPALIFYRYFRGQIDAYTVEFEAIGERFLSHLLTFKA